jgi:UPF0716 family protein affecting phage T7 exclusion
MRPTVTTRLILLLALVAGVVGFVDAAIGSQWDLAVIFAVVVALDGVLLARHQGRRPPIPVRSDLAGWLRERAATTGEEPEVVADRAIAAYRAGLVGTEPDPGPTPGA